MKIVCEPSLLSWIIIFLFGKISDNILFKFELSEDFQAKMTVEQLKTQLSQFGITPDQMFDQMNKTLIRMKDELDKTS